MTSAAARRLVRVTALYLSIVLAVGGGVAAAAWSSLGPRYALMAGALAALEGAAVVVVAGVAAHRSATRLQRETRTWERHQGPLPHEPVALHGRRAPSPNRGPRSF